MAITLSTHATTYKAKKGYAPRIGVEIPTMNQYIALTDSFSVTNGQSYVAISLGSPSVRISTEHMGGVSKVGGMAFKIMNQDLFSNLFATHPNPESYDVTCKLFFYDGSNAMLEADAVQIFKGRITDFPDISWNEVNIQVESLDNTTDRTIGRFVTDETDSDVPLPEESEGKVIPIIYGDQTGIDNYASTTLADTHFVKSHPLTPAVFIGYAGSGGSTTTGKQRWAIADHEMHTIAPGGGQRFWAMDDDLGKLVEIKPSDITIIKNDSTGCIIELPEEVSYYDYMLPTGTGGSEPGSGDPHQGEAWSSDVQYRDSVLNKSVADPYCKIWGYNDGRDQAEGGQNIDPRLYCHFQQGSPLHDDDVTEVKVFAVGQMFEGANQAGGGYFEINGVNLPHPADNNGVTAKELHSCGTNPSTQDGTGYTVTCKHFEPYDQAGASSDRYESRVWQVWKRVEYLARKREQNDDGDTVVLPRNIQLYSAGKGMKYGTWINTRTGTETHADNNGAGNVISNGAGVIESLLRDHMDFTSAAIDMNQFNVASNDLSTVDIAFSILQQKKARDFVHNIAKRTRSAFFWDYNNQANLKVFVPADPFSISGEATTPDGKDIFIDTPTSSGGSFTQHPIVKGSMSISKSKDDLITDITINYGKNFERNYMHTTQSTNETFHSGFVQTYDHDYTYDTTTAQFWRDWILSRQGRKQYKVKFKTFLNAVNVENYDIVNVRHPVLDGIFGTATMEAKKWLVLNTNANLSNMEISLECIEC